VKKSIEDSKKELEGLSKTGTNKMAQFDKKIEFLSKKF